MSTIEQFKDKDIELALSGGIIQPKIKNRFKVLHYTNENEKSKHSEIITLQTIECTPIKKQFGGNFVLVLEDDIHNRVLDYINDSFNITNNFLIEIFDNNLKTLSKIYLENCSVASISSELDYGESAAHRFTINYSVNNFQYLK